MLSKVKASGKWVVLVLGTLIVAWIIGNADPALTFRSVRCGSDSVPTTALVPQDSDNVNPCHLVGQDPTAISTSLIIENEAEGGVKWTLASLGGSDLGFGLFQIFNPAATCGPAALHGCPAISIDPQQNVALGQPFPRAKLDISGEDINGTNVSIENTSGDGIRWVLRALAGDPIVGSGFRILNPAFTGEGEPVVLVHGEPAISIDPNQNIAIGQPFPQAKLHIFGGARTGTSLLIESAGSIDLLRAIDLSSDASDGVRLVVKREGNVGIGTPSPLSKLAISGLPTAPPDGSGTAGILCITNSGNIWIDTTPATPCF